MKKESEGFDIEDEEVFFEHSTNSPEDQEFDLIISCLEEILMDDSFQSLLSSFYDKHCDSFEESKENKLEYTEIHNKYTTLIENTLESFLSKRIPNFSMKRFENLISSKQDELSGEVFDLLLSLADFMEFKDTMLSHKTAKVSTVFTKSNDLDKLDLSITGNSTTNNKKVQKATSNKKVSNSFDLSISGKKI